MKKIKLPKKSFAGLKIYCNKCKRYNPKCKHENNKLFRGVIHVPGTKNNTKVKSLISQSYESAVQELINIKRDLERNNYQFNSFIQNKNYTIIGAIIKYNQYLSGEYSLKHLKKNISDEHRKDIIRFLKLFHKSLKKHHNLEIVKVNDITNYDVSNFYGLMEQKYSARTFNKCMVSLKSFFNFLIEIEDINCKNPFAVFNRKKVIKTSVETINKFEFDAIINCIDNSSPYMKLGGKGEVKNMYRDYLIDGFKLFLFTGLRREEVVTLRWSDIYFVNETYFLKVKNKKVERNENLNGEFTKYVPINSDLFKLLIDMGFEKMKSTNNYILSPNRIESTKTIMNSLSKSFSHYRDQANISKNISLKHLRKTYISWVNQALGKETGKITSHSSEAILKEHYIDPKILSLIHKGALDIQIFN